MILNIVSFILVLGFLVFIHELGHYLAARHVGVRVERFSIGFPPRAFGRVVGETEYVFSWVPLGGYVKLYGQNLDDEDPNDPRNFAAKTKLQRLYILAAGPVMNLVVALLLMPMVYLMGVEVPAYRLEAPVLAEVTPDSPAGAAGFRTEDQIIEADGTAVPTWNALYDWIEKRVIRNGTVVFTVLREGKQVPVSVEASAFATTRSFGWRPQLPAVVGTFSAGSAAREAGLVHGDRILSIDGAPIPRWEDLTRFIQEGRGQPQEFEVRRGAEVLRLKVSARKAAGEDRWLIGVSPATYAEKHGLAQSIALGSQRLWDLTVGTFSFIGHALSGKASLDAVGGPVKIGVVIGEAARHGLSDLLFLMAVISLQLGIFNLLPIPALDGGHITLLGAEALKRSPLSAKVRERTQMIGFSLLILLILTVTYNDVISLLG